MNSSNSQGVPKEYRWRWIRKILEEGNHPKKEDVANALSYEQPVPMVVREFLANYLRTGKWGRKLVDIHPRKLDAFLSDPRFEAIPHIQVRMYCCEICALLQKGIMRQEALNRVCAKEPLLEVHELDEIFQELEKTPKFSKARYANMNKRLVVDDIAEEFGLDAQNLWDFIHIRQYERI